MFYILPYVGQVLLLAVLATVMLGRLVNGTRQRMIFLAVLLLMGLFIPVSGLSAAQWLRSIVGDLSVVTLVIFANILAQRLFNFSLVEPSSRNILLLATVLLGLVFYPLALGMSSFDPYQLGYSPVILSVLLSLASIFAWLRDKRSLAIILLMPLIAFNLHLLESANLWDYLLDPILMIYAVVQSVLRLEFSRFNKDGSTK